MNFSVNYEHYDKLINILEHIDEKLNINSNDFTFDKKGGEYFKTKVYNETCFKENIKTTLILKEGNVIPKEEQDIFTPEIDVMYTCIALLQIQSIFFNMKNDKDDISYYRQLLLDQCVYKRFINYTIFHPELLFTDTEPESESEEEINEDTVLNE